jgi:hypothetical protein
MSTNLEAAVAGDPNRTPLRGKPMTLVLTGVALLAALVTLLPQPYRPWNLSAIGSLGLFAAARLGFWPGVGLLMIALGLKDVGVLLIHGWTPAPLVWLCFGGYVLLGWIFLQQTESPLKIGATALGASLVFFVVTNFLAWLGQALPYGYSFAGLVECYVAALPFYRGTLTGDLLFTGVLFGAHGVLSRTYFPAERVVTVETPP